jgi:hypothetical protein
MATCPECDFDEIETVAYDEGDTLSCPECGTNLVVMAGNSLEAADDDEDDLDDDLDEDEDEDDAEDDDDDDDDDEDEEEDFDE